MYKKYIVNIRETLIVMKIFLVG